MSERAVQWSLLLLLSATVAHAQERILSAPAELSAARRGRADSLAAIEHERLLRWEARRSQLRATDAVPQRAVSAPLDTVRIGELVLVRAPADSSLPLALAGAAASRLLYQRYGDAARGFMHASVRVVRRDTSDAMQEVPPGTAVVDEGAPIDEMGLRIADRVPATAPDVRLMSWAGGSVALDPPGRSEAEAYYRRLALHGEAEVRGCFAGRAVDCRRAFGFGDRDLLYPTLADRQRAVRRLPVSSLGPWKTGVEACLAGDDGWCVRALSDASLAAIAIAMSPSERQDLARFAIHAGGPQGYVRLLGASGMTAEAQLAAAAGEPIDTVLLQWRAAVIAGRPQPMALRPAALLAAGVWIAMAVLAAAGSSRWRLG